LPAISYKLQKQKGMFSLFAVRSSLFGKLETSFFRIPYTVLRIPREKLCALCIGGDRGDEGLARAQSALADEHGRGGAEGRTPGLKQRELSAVSCKLSAGTRPF